VSLKNILAVALGIFSATGGFVDIGETQADGLSRDAVDVPWCEVDAATSVVTLRAPAGRAALEPRRRPLGSPHEKGARIVMRLSELLNREVVSESGHQLGHVHDVRGELVEGHLAGGRPGHRQAQHPGALWRRHPRGRRTGAGEGARPPNHPWERVVRIGAKVVVND
jgi:sporulation protein YlmC with PRC-barrel domain